MKQDPRYKEGICECKANGKWKYIDGLLTCIKCGKPKYWPNQWTIDPPKPKGWWEYD